MQSKIPSDKNTTKTLFRLMLYLFCVKYVTTARAKEARNIYCSFAYSSLERLFYCYKIIKVLQLNHSQKKVLIVGRKLIEPTPES